MHLLLSAGACSCDAAPAPAAIDRYLLRAQRSAANLPPVDWWQRQANGPTVGRSTVTSVVDSWVQYFIVAVAVFLNRAAAVFCFLIVFLLFVFFVPCAILNRLTVTLSACKYYIVSYRIVSCLCTTWLEISNVESIILDAAIYARQCWFPVLRGCLKRAIFLLSFLSSQAYCQAVRSLVIICEQLWNLIRPL